MRYHDDLSALNVILENGVDINCKNRIGKTALMICAEHEGKLVASLLEKGACVNIVDNLGRTVVYNCAVAGNYKSLCVLSKFGANLSCLDQRNRNALHWIASRSKLNYDIIELFKNNEKLLSVKDNTSYTPIDYIKMNNSPAICKLLINQLEESNINNSI